MSMLSKFLVFISLTLVIYAYWPTLKNDYVTEDQWRAFRYSVSSQTPSFRWKACVDMNFPSYFMIGRPLQWFGECLEHAEVSQIKDFVYLRSGALLMILGAVVYLGYVLGGWMGGWAAGTVASSLFVFVPGFTFLSFSGMTSAMELLSLPLAAFSFLQFHRWFRKREYGKQPLSLWVSVFAFILACLIYPIYAFIVFSMALLRFGFDESLPVLKRGKELLATIIFYVLSSGVYYLFVRFFIHFFGSLPSEDPHSISLQLNLSLLGERVMDVLNLIYRIPILNFYSFWGAGFILMFLFSLKVGMEVARKDREPAASAMIWSIGFFMLTLAVLVLSLSPWLFSHYAFLSSRCQVPVDLFFGAALIGLIWSVAKDFSEQIKRLVPVLLVIFLLAPSAIVQNSYSYSEVLISQQEIKLLRSSLEKWFEEKGYRNSRYLMVVRPPKRNSKLEKEWAGNRWLAENIYLSSGANPVTVPWMVNAIFREHAIEETEEIVNCFFDQNCAQSFLGQGKIVLGMTDGSEVIKSDMPPFLINFSLLTLQPIYPKIEKRR